MMAVGGDAGRNNFSSFLGEARSAIAKRSILFPWLILLVVLTASNIVIFFNIPSEGAGPPLPFLAAAAIRIGGLIFLTVTILRLATGSQRSPWRPDGAFWLYAATIVLSFAVAAAIGQLLGNEMTAGAIAVRNVFSTVLLAPFAPWLVGMAVATPLGWRPSRFMQGFGRWLPPLILWSLVLVTPLAVLHALIDMRLIAGVGDWFWPLALFDGGLSAVMVLIGSALNVAAYRRVAPE